MKLQLNQNGLDGDDANYGADQDVQKRRIEAAAEPYGNNGLLLRIVVLATLTALRSVWRKDGFHWPAGRSIFSLA
jgi:hypothetical protein